MAVGKQERERRWVALRQLMATQELDAVIIRGNCENPHSLYFADVQLRSIPNSVFALTRAGDARMFILNPYDAGEPVPLYRDDSSVMAERDTDVRRPVPSGLAPWLLARKVKRIGVPGLVSLPLPILGALKDALPGVEMLDIGPQMDELRWTKSAAEHQYIRQSAACADHVWSTMRDFLRPGRTINQLLSDIDHFLVEEGCDRTGYAYEGSFLMALPFKLPLCGWNDRLPMQAGDVLNLEVSPRYQGYFTQLTSPVSIGPVKPDIRRAYEAVLKSRAAALPHVRAGVQSKVASDAMLASLAEDGYEPCNPNIGHLMGFTLEELRVGQMPFTFKAGMALVLHPIIKSAHFKMLMRGDTYLVTEGEPERLTHYSTDILEV